MPVGQGKTAAIIAAATKSAVQKNFFNTQIEAQSASAGPPLGPLLGNFGINIGNFCKDFNERTKHMRKGIPLPVTVRVKPDRTYNIELHTPPTNYLLQQAAGIEVAKLDGEGPGVAGKVTIKHIYELAKLKNEDQYSKLYVMDLEEVVKYIAGKAYLLGIEVVRDLDPVEYQEFLDKRYAYIQEIAKQLEEEARAKLQRSA